MWLPQKKHVQHSTLNISVQESFSPSAWLPKSWGWLELGRLFQKNKRMHCAHYNAWAHTTTQPSQQPHIRSSGRVRPHLAIHLVRWCGCAFKYVPGMCKQGLSRETTMGVSNMHSVQGRWLKRSIEPRSWWLKLYYIYNISWSTWHEMIQYLCTGVCQDGHVDTGVTKKSTKMLLSQNIASSSTKQWAKRGLLPGGSVNWSSACSWNMLERDWWSTAFGTIWNLVCRILDFCRQGSAVTNWN